MKRAQIFLLTMILSLIFAPIVLAQSEPTEPTNMEYLALLFNAGIVAALVQIIKWKVFPYLKKNVPYMIPIVGMCIGVLGAWVMNETGIDLSPIGDIFGAGIASGALASAGFAIVKEAHNASKGKQ